MGSSEQLRLDYVWALARAFAAIDSVDRLRIIKLYQVFAQMESDDTTRLEILRAVVDDPKRLADRPVSETILYDPDLRATLARDYMVLLGQESDDRPTPSSAFTSDYFRLVGIGKEQVAVLQNWVSIENRILRAMGAGDEWMADEKDWRELASRTAGIGLPLAMLYGSGIVGFSAVGLTSGLAAIGGSAVGAGLVALGLNPMTAGIAVLIGVGIGVKKAADYALGVGEKRKAEEARAERGRRLEMLTRSIAMLAADRAALSLSDGGLAPERTERRQEVSTAMSHALTGLQSLTTKLK